MKVIKRVLTHPVNENLAGVDAEAHSGRTLSPPSDDDAEPESVPYDPILESYDHDFSEHNEESDYNDDSVRASLYSSEDSVRASLYSSDSFEMYPTDEHDTNHKPLRGFSKAKHKHKHNEELDAIDYTDIYQLEENERSPENVESSQTSDNDNTENENLEDFDAEAHSGRTLSPTTYVEQSDNIEIIGKDISTSKPSRFSNLEEYANSHPLAITKPERFENVVQSETPQGLMQRRTAAGLCPLRLTSMQSPKAEPGQSPPSTDNIKYKDFYIDFEKKIIDIIFNIVLPPICYLYPLENLDSSPSTISLLKPKFRAYENGEVFALSYIKIDNIKTFVKLKHGYKIRYNDITLYIYNTSLLGLLFPSTHSLSFDMITKMKINRGFSEYVRNGCVSPQNKLNGRSKNIMNAIKRVTKNFTEEEREGFISEVFA